MVGDTEREVGPRYARTARLHLRKTVMRTLVYEMPIDPKQCVAVITRDNSVGIPKLVDDRFPCLGHFHHSPWIIGELSYNVDN